MIGDGKGKKKVERTRRGRLYVCDFSLQPLRIVSLSVHECESNHPAGC